ncbi:MAG: diguanylate cyclase, partial [Rhodocyclaceae bacterium]|nr:diguanylate cyclase [Rhodocyclaceae bacterium]
LDAKLQGTRDDLVEVIVDPEKLTSYGIRPDVLIQGFTANNQLIAAGAMQASLRAIDADLANLARERGAVLFRLIEITRDWNARHGGVYVPVTDQTQPNPYLSHPRRDITDNHGRQLTLINPAFMTRQIAAIAEQVEGARFHITSLKPIRPANAADPWEAESLALFEQTGLTERLAFFPDGGGGMAQPVHRYMAPLLVKEACLACHAAQGYQVGDVRGGISVTMPAEKLLALGQQRKKQVMLLYLAGFVVIAALGHLIAWRTRRHLDLLAMINARQESLIAARTHDLAEANAALEREISEVASARRETEQERRLAAAVFECAAEGIMVTDRDNRILRVNPAFSAITGYAPDEVLGRDPKLLKSGRHDAAFYAEMWRHINEVGRWEGEIWNRRKNGEVYVEWLAITTIADAGGEGRHVATFIDITKRKEAEETILHRANFDALTNLPNRNLFEDRLIGVLAMARRHRRRFALLYIDLDFFKEVNDSLGHSAGDLLLVEVARRLERCVRDADTVARLGGDEFVLLLADLNDAWEAEEVAQRINQAMAQEF